MPLGGIGGQQPADTIPMQIPDFGKRPTDPIHDALQRAKGDANMTALINAMIEEHRLQLSQARQDEAEARQAVAKAKAEALEANRLLKENEDSTKAKSMFLAKVSHELRTPLNGMIGMSELLKQTEMTPKQTDYVESIRVCGDTLLQVINDILDFSKLQAGKLRFFNVPFSLQEAVREVIRAVGCTQPADGAVKTFEDLDLPTDLVYGDPIRLHQVLMNLLSNSYKFTQSGAVTIHGRSDASDDSSVRVTCSVQDTGIGITEEQQTRLFRPFSQADSSTGRRFGGSGLGLSICKSIVEMQGGSIGIKSDIGVGTTVSFTITYPKATPDSKSTISDVSADNFDPLAGYIRPVDSDSKSKDPQNPHMDLSQIPRDKIRLCIAEDNPINQKIAVSFVQRLGLKVDAYDDGRSAVDALRAKAKQGDPYHIVLMDVQMPVLDGYKATRLLRLDENKAVRDVLVIAMTASAIEGDREECLNSGMNDYLAKPVRTDALTKMLDSYLAPRDFQPSMTRPSPNTLDSNSSTLSASSARSTSLRPSVSPDRPKANRASTGTPLFPRRESGSDSSDDQRYGSNNKPVRPKIIPRHTTAGRVETLSYNARARRKDSE